MLVIGLSVLPAASASAAARRQSVNGIADLGALNAYHTYLSTLTGGADSSAAADTGIVDTVASDCANALTDLNQLSAAQLEQSALTSFGNEVDADLALAYIGPSKAALTKFGGALDVLTWSTDTELGTTARLIATERALLNTPESDVCADATTLDAAPLSEPTTTQRFLAHYRTAARNLKTALAAFQTLLGRYETGAERKLVAQINTLVSQFSAQSSSSQQADAATVLSELGIQG